MQTRTATTLTPFVSESYDVRGATEEATVIDEERPTTEEDDQKDDIALHKDTLEDLDAIDSEADVLGAGVQTRDCAQTGQTGDPDS